LAAANAGGGECKAGRDAQGKEARAETGARRGSADAVRNATQRGEGSAEVVGRAGSCGENASQLYGATVTSGAGDAVCASARPKTDETRTARLGLLHATAMESVPASSLGDPDKLSTLISAFPTVVSLAPSQKVEGH